MMAKNWKRPTVIKRWIDPDWAKSIANRLRYMTVGVENDAVGSLGERGKYRVLETSLVEFVAPELTYLYDLVPDVLRERFDIEVIDSPHERSRINIKVYEGEGSGQGLHNDSQPITVLLCLNPGKPLQVYLESDVITEVEMDCGDLLVFCGKEYAHRVPLGGPGDFRVTVPMNFYFDGQIDRPEWLDAAIYDNQPSPLING